MKFHPDKLKGDEKELYADVFINLNNLFDTITVGRKDYDFYHTERGVETEVKVEDDKLENH